MSFILAVVFCAGVGSNPENSNEPCLFADNANSPYSTKAECNLAGETYITTDEAKMAADMVSNGPVTYSIYCIQDDEWNDFERYFELVPGLDA